MELFNSNIKKFIILQETETPKKLLIFSQKKAVFRKTENPQKILFISGKGSPEKISYISGSNFLSFKSKKFLVFQEMKLSSSTLKKLLIF